MAETKELYPVSLSIDYPDKSEKLTTFFRIFTVIPILIILGLLMGGDSESNSVQGCKSICYGGGFVFASTILMILFRKKYPKWWFDWNVSLAKFGTRVFSYLLLLRHEYPSTDEEQAVHIEIPYPDVKVELNCGMPLVKWFLAIPHLFILIFLYIAVAVCTVISWFTILFTGNYQRGLFDFVVGVIRWSLRVSAYAILLTTDRYPPFRLSD
jgi:hypothetical protein